MANTPNQKEMLTRRKAKSAEVRKQVQEVRGRTLEERRRKEVYDNISKLRLKEMEFMRTKKWPATKQGIKNIALPLPNLEQIRYDATQTINNTSL